MYCLVIKDRLMRSKVNLKKKKKERKRKTLKSSTRIHVRPGSRNANNLLHSRPKEYID